MPPRTGPAVRPEATTEPISPRALPRTVSGKGSTMRAGVQAMVMAAPSPWKKRDPMSQPAEGAVAQKREPTEKSSRPRL